MEKPETTVGMIDVLQGVYKGNTEGEKYVADILAEGLPHLHNLQSELSRSGYAGVIVKKIRDFHPEQFDVATQGINAIQIEGQVIPLIPLAHLRQPTQPP